jgi:hypothetical protein
LSRIFRKLFQWLKVVHALIDLMDRCQIIIKVIEEPFHTDEVVECISILLS